MNDFIRQNKMLLKVQNGREQPEHFHQEVELLYVLEGTLELRFLDQKAVLKPEDVAVINSNEGHAVYAAAEVLYVSVFFDYKMMSQVYNGISNRFRCNSALEDAQDYERLRRILKNLLLNYMYAQNETGMEGSAGFGYAAGYFHLMEFLTEHFLVHASKEMLTEQGKSRQRIFQIRDYLEGNYSKRITFQNLAEHLYLSEGYLSRIFREAFHMNYTEYLNKVRLSHAMEELLYTERPITQIAYDNGFSSISFFNKSFKREYGKTPTMFREEGIPSPKTEETQTESPELTDKLEAFLGETQKDDEDAECDVTRAELSAVCQEKIEHNWNKVINIGAASDLLKSEIQEHVILLSSALGYQYIRFWSIFAKEMLIDVHDEEGDFNFSRLDQVLDFLVERGMKPFIDLEEKPRRINADSEHTILYEENIPEFQNIEQWERLIGALLRHLAERYGLEETSSWKLEVWFGGYRLAGKSGFSGYFELLKSVQLLVRKYIPGMEVGGPGMFPQFIHDMQDRQIDFWREWGRRAYVPDFVSLMNYAYDANPEKEHFGRKSRDEQYLLHGILRLKRELAAAGLPEVKIYITEWNLTVSDRNYVNDSCFQGAYIVKNIIDVCRQVDMIGYYTGSDRMTEYYDSNQLLYGGQGLLNKEGIFKPAAFAIEFLNHMYGYYVGSGENYLITGNGRKSYRIILHNMRPLSYYYFTREESHLEKDQVWQCFADQNQRKLTLVMNDMENGSYLVKSHRIHRDSGSILDIWKGLDYFRKLSREDVKYFRRVCEPGLAIRKYSVQDNRMELEICLEPNEIAFVEVHPEL